MFSFFKKKNNEKVDESVNSFIDLWNTNINDIWDISEKNSFVIAMNGWVSQKCNYGSSMKNLSAQERIFYIVQQLESEVNNGGFSQYFYNTRGEFICELSNVFSIIGAEITANICKKAVAAFGTNIPSTRSEREKFINEMIDDKMISFFEKCDSEFFKYLDDLEELNYCFIINNKKYFS